MPATKIELIGDGSGSVYVFIDGQPVKEDWFCEYRLEPELVHLLENHLCEFPPRDQSDAE